MTEKDIVKTEVTVEIGLSRDELERILWTADTYSPQIFWLYYKPDKNWVDDLLDGKTVKLVTENQLDTGIFWSSVGPDRDDNGLPRIDEGEEPFEITLDDLRKGFKKWVRRFNGLPEYYDAENCAMLLQYTVFGKIAIG